VTIGGDVHVQIEPEKLNKDGGTFEIEVSSRIASRSSSPSLCHRQSGPRPPATTAVLSAAKAALREAAK
jgi:hypothetical protein